MQNSPSAAVPGIETRKEVILIFVLATLEYLKHTHLGTFALEMALIFHDFGVLIRLALILTILIITCGFKRIRTHRS